MGGCITHQLHPAAQVQLIHNIGAVRFERAHTQVQDFGNLADSMSLDDQLGTLFDIFSPF